MKSFRRVFSKLDKIVRQTVIRLFKLIDFLLGFIQSMSFSRRTGNSVFFRVLGQRFGYF